MPYFGKTSNRRLSTCQPIIQLLAREVVKEFDCSVLCGHRGQAKQDAAFALGDSTVKFPDSRHNFEPSEAIDLAPWKAWGSNRRSIVWPGPETATYAKDLAVWYHFGGFVLGVAYRMGIDIRWGGDWDGDRQVNDQRFDDLPHFELRS